MVHKNSLLRGMKKKFPKTLIKNALHAHHPTCEKYNNHIIWLFGRAFCIGCTLFYTGLFIGTVLFLALSRVRVRSWLEMGIIWTIGLFLFLSFLPQLKIKETTKHAKVLKIILRFNLGFGSALLILSVMVKAPVDYIGIIIRFVSIGLYFGLYKLFFYLRGKRKEDYCYDCPKGKYPFCSHNYKQIVDTITYLDEEEEQDSFLYDFLTKLERQIREPENSGELIEFIVD